LAGGQRSLLLDDARLASARPPTRVLLYDVYAFNNYFVIGNMHLAHTPPFSLILAGNHQHCVISLNVHSISYSHEFYSQVLSCRYAQLKTHNSKLITYKTSGAREII